ncbi:tlde1 domain-containing protein [Campylobacter concisus]|uniref:tlde1 domain-containing protein n=1 Tax=Campylobacter concisus TaxID=199 RepID=UPI00122CCF89|nr:tlde1 domain-containing protein [Campylobacter concisus]
MNNKQESNLDNLNRDKRDKFLNNLEMAKNLLTVAGDIATSVSPLKNISSAKGLILMQSTAGGVIVDTAKGDTWDEQIVGIVGDFVGQVFLYATLKGSATPLNSALTLSGNHLGSHLKNALKSMKLYDKENSYTYTYKKDFQAMVGGQLQKVPYAKVPINRNGEMVTTPTHQPLYYTSNEAEYNHYETIKNSVKEKEISELSFKEICDFFAVLNTPMSSEYNKALKYNNDKQELIEDKQTLYEIFSAYASENGIDAETSLSPFSEKLHSFIKEAISTIFSLKNIYVVSISSDGTNNISKINKALKKREENSEFKAGNKEEILLICPYHSAQIIAPYQPKNTKFTIILADKTYLDCVNLNPQGSKDESKLILTNYKFNPYEANSKEEDIKFVDSATSGDVTLYKDSNNKFISQDKKYSYDGSKVTLNFFNNLNFNLLNFAKENGFSLRGDKSSAMFDVRLKLADKEESKPTTNSGNCNLIVKNLIITDENLNSSDIKEIYLHNCEDKRVYRSCSLEKNDNDEADKNSYTAKFNINLILDKDQSVFKRTTKFILAYRDLSKDYSTSDIHSMSDNGVISLEAKKKAEGSITYDLKTSLIEVANNITGVVVDIQNIDQTTIKDTINLKAIYKPNKGDDNYKEVNWSYKIIKQGEYNKEVKANFVANDIKLEGEKFKGKEISFTPQTDIKDQKLLDKLKEGDSTLVFFAYLKAPRYTTRYGKTHGRVDINYEKSLFLEFDGEFLSIHITYNELKQVHSFKAVSGAPIKSGSNYFFDYSKKRQLLANEGPVPEGTYYITPLSSNKDDAIQYWEKLDNVQHFKASIAMGSWPGGKKSWGNVRIPILPKSITLLDENKEIKRKNFFIHGGEKAGSRGCIDLCENDMQFFEILLSYIELIKSENKIPLIIKYKQKNIKCNSDLKLKFCTEETDHDQDF